MTFLCGFVTTRDHFDFTKMLFNVSLSFDQSDEQTQSDEDSVTQLKAQNKWVSWPWVEIVCQLLQRPSLCSYQQTNLLQARQQRQIPPQKKLEFLKEGRKWLTRLFFFKSTRRQTNPEFSSFSLPERHPPELHYPDSQLWSKQHSSAPFQWVHLQRNDSSLTMYSPPCWPLRKT